MSSRQTSEIVAVFSVAALLLMEIREHYVRYISQFLIHLSESNLECL